KGVEVYRGEPILYGLGNFLFEGTERRMVSGTVARQAMEPFRPFYGEHLNLTSHRKTDSKRSMFVRIAAGRSGVTGVSIVPCSLDDDRGPVQLQPSTQDFDEYVEYLGRITADAGLN